MDEENGIATLLKVLLFGAIGFIAFLVLGFIVLYMICMGISG